MSPSDTSRPTSERGAKPETTTMRPRHRSEKHGGANGEGTGSNASDLPHSGVVSYEVINRDYSPDHEEVVYDAQARQFYRVILHSQVPGGQDDMISLRPLPDDASTIPITDLSTDIAQAIDNDAFYRVTVNPEAVFNHAVWLQTAKADAPDPAGSTEEASAPEKWRHDANPDDEISIPQMIDDEWVTLQSEKSNS